MGLIGAGRIGQLHARNLSWLIPQSNLLMVTDIVEETARACAKRFQIPHSSADYRDILGNDNIDAVVICSSTDTHTQIIEEAAKARKHVFCEKPIDFDLDRIDSALAAVDQAGIILQIGFNRRFDATFQRIRKAVATGEIGKPHQLHIISRDPAPPPREYLLKSGGIFMDMTIHDFDMARFLIGVDVTEIYATGNVLIDPAIEEAGDFDTVTVVLKFADGTVGIIQNSRQAVYGYDQRAEVFGSDGSVTCDNVYLNNAQLSIRDQIYKDPPLDFFLERYRESFIEEMRQFVVAAMTGGASPVSGWDARIPVVMGKAAFLSCQENRPVRLEEIQ
jgi:myo-inositol 2-dehydrogenase/D-chiro-inositol 1-dehydrogenase